mmetsp:Transcript_79514/g.233756  ORF Transcript_79514/g.233756 Transcript_79514/m.233756 type:complete len:291 (+) Transcript_79514:32-904(+)
MARVRLWRRSSGAAPTTENFNDIDGGQHVLAPLSRRRSSLSSPKYTTAWQASCNPRRRSVSPWETGKRPEAEIQLPNLKEKSSAICRSISVSTTCSSDDSTWVPRRESAPWKARSNVNSPVNGVAASGVHVEARAINTDKASLPPSMPGSRIPSPCPASPLPSTGAAESRPGNSNRLTSKEVDSLFNKLFDDVQSGLYQLDDLQEDAHIEIPDPMARSKSKRTTSRRPVERKATDPAKSSPEGQDLLRAKLVLRRVRESIRAMEDTNQNSSRRLNETLASGLMRGPVLRE